MVVGEVLKATIEKRDQEHCAVIAMTQKKNNQRGPTVGRVEVINRINPPHPMMNRKIAAGRKLATRGELLAFILG
jgi:hypothetical protein